MCRVMGLSMGIITVMLGICACFGNKVPGFFVYGFTVITCIDVIVTMILTNTICRRKVPLEVRGTSED